MLSKQIFGPRFDFRLGQISCLIFDLELISRSQAAAILSGHVIALHWHVLDRRRVWWALFRPSSVWAWEPQRSSTVIVRHGRVGEEGCGWLESRLEGVRGVTGVFWRFGVVENRLWGVWGGFG